MSIKGLTIAVAAGLLLGSAVLFSTTSLRSEDSKSGVANLEARAGVVWHVSPLGSDATGDGSLSSPFRTIQNGIGHATDGDTVLVQDGTYHERISFYSKAIIVGSWILRDADTLHTTNTIIDGDSTGLPPSDTLSVVRITDVVGVPVLSGFTIRNGPSDGILCAGAGASVRDCVLLGNDYRKSYGNMTPSVNPSLIRCHLVSCGIGTRSGPLELLQCEIDGLMEGDGPEAMVDADSCVLDGVEIFGTGYFHARSSLIRGDVSCVVAGRNLVNCTVNGVISSIDASLVADSCILGGIRCGNESFSWVYRSIIKGPIKFSPSDLPPWLTLSHCTVVDSIVRVSGNAKIWLDSSNLVLPAPIDLGGLQTWEYLSVDANCSNVYANGLDPWLNVGSSQYASFDTVGITSLPPQFCNPGLGDYRIFDTSPCAPANNSCGVLIGARDIGCLNEHVWHVATTGNDSTGNGTEAAPFATIQKGINRAADGDTVLVEDGTYHERVTYYDRSIVVGSLLLRDGDTVHIANTIINGDPMDLPAADTTAVIRFVGNGTNVPTLVGVTITAGGADVNGVLSISSDPFLQQCRFEGVDVCVYQSQPTSTPVIRECALINCGVRIESAGHIEVKIGHSLVQGELITAQPSSTENCFYVDSSTVEKVNLRTHGWLISRASIFEDSIKGYMFTRAHLKDCKVGGGIYLGTEAVLVADSSLINGIDCGNEFWCYVNYSVVTGPIKVDAPYDIEPFITLRHSTVVDSIVRVSGRRIYLRADTCNIVLPAPIAFDENWRRLYFYCCNIYAAGGPWYTGVHDTASASDVFDTVNVFSQPPQFCNPNLGDYTLFDTSPCAPANNPCGVLIGARDIGCLNEHVWHVATSGSDSNGNGTEAAPFATIQKGINRAADGDTVLVQDGTYHERIVISAKSIALGSMILVDSDTAHVGHTIIDADPSWLPESDTNSALTIKSPCVIEGFTITNSEEFAIYNYLSHIVIKNCRFDHNDVFFYDAAGRIEDCRFISCGFIGSDSVTLLKSDVEGDVSASSVLLVPTIRDTRILGDLRRIKSGRITNTEIMGNISIQVAPLVAPFIADSSSIRLIEGLSEEVCVIIDRSVIQGAVNVPRVQISGSTIQGLILPSTFSSTDLMLNSCNVVLEVPLNPEGQWDSIHVDCSNIYAGDSAWFGGDTTEILLLDTSNVLSLDPLFCNPEAGDYHVLNTSPCAPANNPCGVQIGAYGVGCLDSGEDNWSFGNSEANMWPSSWWQQFNYCFGVSPCDQYCLLCSPSTFPDWELFVSAIGESAAYFDPPPGIVAFRPSAVAQWEALRGDWTGSCFGFAASSFLFFDDYFRVDSLFPGHTKLATVPLSSASRQLINRLYLYQFGHSQQLQFNEELATTTPAQTLTECQSMFARIPRNDQVLMMFNQAGPGGHAVAPYRCVQSGGDPDLWYLYVHDSNLPNDTTQRVTIDLESDSWSYSGQPAWGGRTGLFLADSVSSYLLPLVLADTAEGTRKATAYFGKADSILIESDSDSLGFNGWQPFGSIEGVSPIIPADGAETMPIGYLLPTGEWYFRGSGVIDGVFTVVDGQKRIFRNGGAKSGIISCNFSSDSTTAALTAFGWSPVKATRDIYDSSFIEIISIEPDSEIVVNVSGLGLMQGDSVTLTLNSENLVQVDNFGSETSYDLEIQIVTQTQDTSFYSENIAIGASTSHLIMPDWRPSGDSVVIAVDTSMTGGFDSTIVIANEQPPQFLCGDADGSNLVTISDAVYLINYIFAGGPPPSPTIRGDADCNGIVTISDAVYLINYIFAGGAQPCAGCP